MAVDAGAFRQWLPSIVPILADRSFPLDPTPGRDQVECHQNFTQWKEETVVLFLVIGSRAAGKHQSDMEVNEPY